MFIIDFLRKKRKQLSIYRELGNVYKCGYRKGFCPSTVDVCGITKENYTQFLSDFDYYWGHPYNNGPYSSIIDNKLWLPFMLHNYKEYIPEYYFFIDKKGLLPLEDSEYFRTQTRLTISYFFELLEQKQILVLKHTHSSVGKGFMLVKFINDEYSVNNKKVSKSELENIISSLNEYIVTEYVVQHHYASEVCSTSLNTLRFLCVWDDEKNSFFLARCFHRFGCNGNVVDNIGSGNGILVFVDTETGTLKSQGSYNSKHSGDKFAENIIHPDHNIILSGLQIPRFNEIKSKILEIANSHSYLRYVGFDVAITENSFKIIELNSRSSLDVTQQREGFLADERIRKVLKK